jgi:hypothetical protein
MTPAMMPTIKPRIGDQIDFMWNDRRFAEPLKMGAPSRQIHSKAFEIVERTVG